MQMSTVVISDEASEDLRQLWLFLSQRSPAAADGILHEIGDRIQLLASVPRIGRPRDDLGRNIRTSVVRSLLIFYRPTNDGIGVLRILDGRRDYSSLLI